MLLLSITLNIKITKIIMHPDYFVFVWHHYTAAPKSLFTLLLYTHIHTNICATGQSYLVLANNGSLFLDYKVLTMQKKTFASRQCVKVLDILSNLAFCHMAKIWNMLRAFYHQVLISRKGGESVLFY